MTALREAVLQADILLKWGAHPRVRLWRTTAGKAWAASNGGSGFRPIQMNPTGSTDLTGIVTVAGRGLFLAIEVKSATGRPSKEQLRWRAMLEERGAVYVLARTMDDVDRVLEPLLARSAA